MKISLHYVFTWINILATVGNKPSQKLIRETTTYQASLDPSHLLFVSQGDAR